VKNHVLEQAHVHIRSSFRIDFDERLFTIRRSIMVSSTVAIAASFIKPKSENGYEVNLGVIRGLVDQPQLMYLFIAFAVVYYFIWFQSHIKSLKSASYFSLKTNFFRQVSKDLANDVCLNICDSKIKTIPDFPRVAFFSISGVTEVGEEFVVKTITTTYLSNLRKIRSELIENGIQVEDKGDKIILMYKYRPVLEDYTFLSLIKNDYFIDFFQKTIVIRVPQLYALFSLALISHRIYLI